MTIEVLGVTVVARVGSPFRLSLEVLPATGGAGILMPVPSSLPAGAAQESLIRARQYVAHVVGLPEDVEFHWSRIPLGIRPLFPITGPSLYGAFSLSLMQAVVLYRPQSVRGLFKGHAAMVRDTRLVRIAISAAFHENGGFEGVGGIEEKLTQLARLGPGLCSLCVVATRQGEIGLPKVFVAPAFTMYRTSNGPEIAVMEAEDPFDTYRKLFEMQSRSGSLAAVRAASL